MAAIAVRRSPRARRRIEATGFRKKGDTVSWHISATLPGMADDGSDVEQRSFVRAAFDADDMISEVWSVDSGTT